MTLRTALIFCLLPAMSLAATLDLPAPGKRVAETGERLGSLRLPITPWEFGGAQTVWAEGAIHHEAWQLEAGRMTTLELLAPLRVQLAAAGFDILYECAAKDCGGFDFRYALEVLPEPEMHVDLGDFRYLAASRAGESHPEYVVLLVSRAAGRGFLQITRVGQAGPLSPTASGPRSDPEPQAGLKLEASTVIRSMVAKGGAVLDDLTFAKGSSELSDSRFASLAALAIFLKENPGAEIVLVGHTDAEGSLQGNIALSKARATAVRARMTGRHKIEEARIQAEGVGFLAPRASNLTEQGRTLNRRVEVILKTPG